MYALGYDSVDQLLSAVLHSNSLSGAILKQYAYTYDSAGNRTGEQIDGDPSAASHNNLNQLTDIAAAGPLRFAGYLSETGAVTVAGSPAMLTDHTNFLGWADTVLGTNIVAVAGTDVSDNRATNEYEIVVSDNVVARTLTCDLNGNLSVSTTAFSTNTYEWDAADRQAGPDYANRHQRAPTSQRVHL